MVVTTGDPSAADVRGITHDSRRVAPGDLFCCLPGATTDGHEHAAEAVARGAVGLLCERAVDGVAAVPQAVVAPGRVRSAMARVAASFYGHPSRDLVMAGVTGTNGKTTVTHLLGSVLRAAGPPPRSSAPSPACAPRRRRPSCSGCWPRSATHRAAGDRAPAVAMEVSSHALAQARVDAVHFDVAVFTNLSHEHLDYHQTMDGVLRRQGRAVHARAGGARGGERRGQLGPTAAGRRPDPPGGGAPGRRLGGRARCREVLVHLARPAGGAGDDRRGQRGERPVGGRGGGGARGRARRRGGGAVRRRRRSPAGSRWWRPRAGGRPARSWSTTPTPRPASRWPWVRPGDWPGPAGGSSWSSAAGGSGTGPSAP